MHRLFASASFCSCMGNLVDVSVRKAEISETRSSIWLVGVRSFVPVWVNITFGCSWRLFYKVCLPCSIVGHLKYLSSCFGSKQFRQVKEFSVWVTKNAAVFGLTVIGGNWSIEPFFLCCSSLRIMFFCWNGGLPELTDQKWMYLVCFLVDRGWRMRDQDLELHLN